MKKMVCLVGGRGKGKVKGILMGFMCFLSNPSIFFIFIFWEEAHQILSLQFGEIIGDKMGKKGRWQNTKTASSLHCDVIDPFFGHRIWFLTNKGIWFLFFLINCGLKKKGFL